MNFVMLRRMRRMMFEVFGCKGRSEVAETSLRHIGRLAVSLALLMSFQLVAMTVKGDDAVERTVDCESWPPGLIEAYYDKGPEDRLAWEARECLTAILIPSTFAEGVPAWAIIEAQELLAALGYEPGVVDYLWEERTAGAYGEFLRDMGLRESEFLTIEGLQALRDKEKETRQAQNEKTAGETFRDCVGCPEMVVVPAGTFMMGSDGSEVAGSRDDREQGPVHRVTIKRDFAVGRYEVTFREWDACALDDGCFHFPHDNGWGRGDRPVINVHWVDAKEYVDWLSRRTGERYRLLSESEWEYVARAGTSTPYHFGSTISTDQANSCNVSGFTVVCRKQTVPVGSFPANDFGLHDVHGNAWEFVEDCWHGSYDGAPRDGSAWTTGGDCDRRVQRGGSWHDPAWRLRSAHRRARSGIWGKTRYGFSGFRVARTLAP